MEEPRVASDEVSKWFDSQEEWGYGAHDQRFVTGDTHVPEREI
jgi:hypothetical protein